LFAIGWIKSETGIRINVRMVMSKVLVTGAGGFIGSHLAEELVRRGEEVRAFVRYNSRDERGLLEDLPKEIQNQVEIILGDLKDPDGVRKAVKGCSKIFHLGALIAIPYSYVHPFDFIQTNVVGTCHLLNACLEEDALERFVHTSTSEVYGTAQYVPIDERHPLQAQSPMPVRSPQISWQRAIISLLVSHPSFDLQYLRPHNPASYSYHHLCRPWAIKNSLRNIVRQISLVERYREGFYQLGKCEEAGKLVTSGLERTSP
jgi:nucleoside-diphosphate-sugar epimerase